jgi:peptidoglycan/LPS O-acetylase OafA/YrhL
MSAQSTGSQESTQDLAPPAALPPPENKLYYPALDGLRALAVSVVFLYHYAANRVFWWGWTGVDLFFVLSGFLITGILYDTLGKRNYFKTFYIRRTLRIFPLYYTVWLIILVLTPFAHIIWNRWLVVWPLYLGNLMRPWALMDGQSIFYVNAYSKGIAQPFLVIGHFWSLCIEEQFYFVWPLVVFLVRDRRKLMSICIAGIVGSILLRCGLWIVFSPAFRGGGVLYTLPITRFDTLLAGAWVALWLRDPSVSIAAARRKFSPVGFGSFVILIATFAFIIWRLGQEPTFSDDRIQTYGFSVIAAVAVWILLACLDPSSLLHRALLWRPLARIGRVSYGIYVIHLIPSLFFERLNAMTTSSILHHLSLPISFAIVYLVAELSFRYLETPFLGLKARWAP